MRPWFYVAFHSLSFACKELFHNRRKVALTFPGLSRNRNAAAYNRSAPVQLQPLDLHGWNTTSARAFCTFPQLPSPLTASSEARRAGAAFSRMAIRPLGANGMGCCIPLKPCREVADRRLPEWIAASVGHQSFVHFNNPKYAYWRHEARAAPHVDTSRCMFLHRAQQDPVLRSLDDAAVATGCSLLLTSHGPRFGSYQPRRLRPSSGLSAV